MPFRTIALVSIVAIVPALAAAPTRAPSTASPESRACIAQARAARTEAGSNVASVRSAYQALRACFGALLESGDTHGAVEAAEEGNRIFFEDPQSGFDYGAVLLLTNGDPDLAKAAIEEALSRHDGPAPSARSERALALNNLGKIAIANGDLAEAKQRLQHAARLDASFAGLFFNLAVVERRLGNAAACASHWETGFSRDPSLATVEDYRNAAWAYGKKGQPASAAAILRRALTVAPHEPGLHLEIGRALAKQQRPLDALLEYDYEVLNGAAGDPAAAEAARLWAEGLETTSAEPFDVQRIGWLRTASSARGKDWKQAIESLEKLKGANVRHPVLDHLRAQALLSSGRMSEAEAVLRASIQADPEFLPAYYDLASLLRESGGKGVKGKTEESRRLVSEAAQRNPLHPRLVGDLEEETANMPRKTQPPSAPSSGSSDRSSRKETPAPTYRGAPAGDDPLLTKAEATGFRETTSYAEVVAFIDRALAEDAARAADGSSSRSEDHPAGDGGNDTAGGGAPPPRGPRLRRASFGRSGEGRDLPYVVVGAPPPADPPAAAASGKLVILLLNNIHAGETDAKDASLILLRQAVRGELDDILARLTLLVVPIYNADGNERLDPMNRLTQLGPDRPVGERVNARGLDLNRDYMKLEAVEAQALIGTLFKEWLPHAVIDGHTTDGSRLRWVLTYGVAQNPAGHPAPIAYSRDLVESARGRFRARTGWDFGPYGNFTDPAHPEKGYETYTSQPRFGASYFGLQNRISILSESYSYVDYRTRVLATLEFERAILDRLAEDSARALETLARAERETIAAGAGDGAAAFPIACEKRPLARPLLVQSFEVETTGAGAEARAVSTARPRDYTVPYAADFVPTRTVVRPYAYLIPVHEPGLVETLRLHGVVVRTLASAVTLEVERYRATDVIAEAKPFQGHRTVTIKAAVETVRLDFPAGTFVVPMAQRAANVAAYLCEPETDDGFATWNRLDHVLVGPIDPDPEEIAVFEQSLIDLPRARERWRDLELPAGISEPEARTEFLARAIGYRSRTANLVPIVRLVRKADLPLR